MITIKLKYIAYLGLAIGLYWLFSHVGIKNKTVRFQCLDKGVISSMYGHPVFYVVLKYENETRTIEEYEADYYIHYKVGSFYTDKGQSLFWKK